MTLSKQSRISRPIPTRALQINPLNATIIKPKLAEEDNYGSSVHQMTSVTWRNLGARRLRLNPDSRQHPTWTRAPRRSPSPSQTQVQPQIRRPEHQTRVSVVTGKLWSLSVSCQLLMNRVVINIFLLINSSVYFFAIVPEPLRGPSLADVFFARADVVLAGSLCSNVEETGAAIRPLIWGGRLQV